MGLESLWDFFFVGWGEIGWNLLCLILLNMAHYTLYEKSCILEIQIEN